MNGFDMLIWLTLLGLNIVLPLTACMLSAVFLRSKYDLGVWIVLLGLLIGLIGAVQGFRTSLKQMDHMAERKSRSRRVNDQK